MLEIVLKSRAVTPFKNHSLHSLCNRLVIEGFSWNPLICFVPLLMCSCYIIRGGAACTSAIKVELAMAQNLGTQLRASQEVLEFIVRASPAVPGSASASGNEKWPPSQMQMQTHVLLSLILHLWCLIFWSLKPWPLISQTHPVHL